MPFVLEDGPNQPTKPAGRFVMEDAPTAVQAGGALNDIPRQLGLTARYGLEGLANTAQIVTEPIRYLTDRLTGQTGKTLPLGELTSRGLDAIGLPKPEGADERVIGDATRLLAGAGGMGALAGAPVQIGRFGGSLFPQSAGTAIASKTATATGNLPQDIALAVRSAPVSSFLSANMPQQLTSAAGAGLAGGASREAGGSPLMQAGASLVGGVAAGTVPGMLGSVASGGRTLLNKLTPAPSAQQLDVQITPIMERAGVDYSQVPERVRQSLRADLADALRTGQELDPAAVRRLADFRATGITPTRGSLTLDPVQVTREMNLAKTGANSADGQLQGLARIQNQNNTRLIQNLNDAGAQGGDPFRAGQSAIGAIGARDAGLERNVSSLYQQARDTSGRAANLDRAAFANRVSELLDEAMVGGALPADVQNKINWIAANAKPQGMHGSIEMPFNVDIAEQLKTQIAKLQRGTSDGSARHALGLVRQALDETPLLPAPTVNPGNLPSVPGTVPQSPAVLGQQSIDAFNQARQAARQRFAWQESGRPIEAALNGAQPDKFVQQFVINGTVADAQSLARNLPQSARNEIRSAILDNIKRQTLSGATDEVGKVSQSAFNKALNGVGDRKLSLFFTPEELASLRANARVASYLQVQPAGSAVNNSNTGALLLGKGIDALAGFANGFPVFGPMVSQPITQGLKNLNIAIRTNQAQDALPGLLARQRRPPFSQGLLLPGIAAGGLLAGASSP